MTTVFISGSREVPAIPVEAKLRIDRIVERGLHVIVGDSERGVDAKVIEYLATREYPHVSVYTIHEKPRARGVLDEWGVQHISPAVEQKVGPDGRVRNARELETAKDVAMGDIADYGLVIWQSAFINRFGRESASKGSLRNMHQLLLRGRPIVLYMIEEACGEHSKFCCVELRSIEELDAVVSTCPNVVRKAYETIARRALDNQGLPLV